MEVLFHFIFELVKIAILSSVYATFTVLLFITIAKYKPNTWFEKVANKKIGLWFISGLIISLALLRFLFSYWGDHGLGDSARIPVGHGKAVNQINGNMTYITANGYEMETLVIYKFATTDNFLFAEISSDRPGAVGKEIAIWDLKTNEVEFLNHSSDIESFKNQNKIKDQLVFQDFQYQYHNYWSGWRFWLLP